MFWEHDDAPGAVIRSSHDALRARRRAFILAGMLVMGLLLSGCGRSQSAAPPTQDDYQVTFATEPAPPVIGDGTVIITVKDKAGQPVDGARLAIEANMNHAGMVPVNAETATSQAGVYRVPLKWTMGGAWYVDIKIATAGGQTIQRRFPVDVK